MKKYYIALILTVVSLMDDSNAFLSLLNRNRRVTEKASMSMHFEEALLGNNLLSSDAIKTERLGYYKLSLVTILLNIIIY